MSGCWINRFLTHFSEHNFAIKGAKVDSLLSTPQSWTSFMCLSCLFCTFVTYLSWKSDVPPMLNIINRSLPAATPPPMAVALSLLSNTQRNLHTPCLERIPRPGSQSTTQGHPMHRTFHASREHDTGAPTSSCPSFYPCTSVPSIISAPPLPSPGPHHVLTKAASQRKEKAEKERRIQPLPCRTVLAEVPSIVPGPASPRLVSPKNTPSSPRKQQPHCWGDGTWGVLLSKGV